MARASDSRSVPLPATTQLIDQLEIVNVCHASSTLCLPPFSAGSSSFTWEKQIANLSLFYRKTWDEAMEYSSIPASVIPSMLSKHSCSSCYSAVTERSESGEPRSKMCCLHPCSEGSSARHQGTESTSSAEGMLLKNRKMCARKRPRTGSNSVSSLSWKAGKPLSREIWLTKVPHLVWGTAVTLPISTQLQPLPDRQCLAPLQAKLVWVVGRTMEQYFFKTFPLMPSRDEQVERPFSSSLPSDFVSSSLTSITTVPASFASPSGSPLPLPYYLIINYGLEPLFVNTFRVERGHSCILRYGDWISFLESAFDREAGVVEPLVVPSTSPTSPLPLTMSNDQWGEHVEETVEEHHSRETQQNTSYTRANTRKKGKRQSSSFPKEVILSTAVKQRAEEENLQNAENYLTQERGAEVECCRPPLRQCVKDWKPQTRSPMSSMPGNSDQPCRSLPHPQQKWSPCTSERGTITRTDFCKSVVRTLLTALDAIVWNDEKGEGNSSDPPWWMHVEEEDFFYQVWRWRFSIAQSPDRQVLPLHPAPTFFSEEEKGMRLGWSIPNLSSSVLRWLYRFHDAQRKRTERGSEEWWRWWWREVGREGIKDVLTDEERCPGVGGNVKEEERMEASVSQENKGRFPFICFTDVVYAPRENVKEREYGDTESDEEEERMFRVRSSSPLREKWRVCFSSCTCSTPPWWTPSSTRFVFIPPSVYGWNDAKGESRRWEKGSTIAADVRSHLYTATRWEAEEEPQKKRKKSVFVLTKEEGEEEETDISFGSHQPIRSGEEKRKKDTSAINGGFDSLLCSPVASGGGNVKQNATQEEGKSSRLPPLGRTSPSLLASSSPVHSTVVLKLIPAALPVYRFVHDMYRDSESKGISSLAASHRRHLLRTSPQANGCGKVFYYYCADENNKAEQMRQDPLKESAKTRSFSQLEEPLWVDLSGQSKMHRKKKKKKSL